MVDEFRALRGILQLDVEETEAFIEAKRFIAELQSSGGNVSATRQRNEDATNRRAERSAERVANTRARGARAASFISSRSQGDLAREVAANDAARDRRSRNVIAQSQIAARSRASNERELLETRAAEQRRIAADEERQTQIRLRQERRILRVRREAAAVLERASNRDSNIRERALREEGSSVAQEILNQFRPRLRGLRGRARDVDFADTVNRRRRANRADRFGRALRFDNIRLQRAIAGGARGMRVLGIAATGATAKLAAAAAVTSTVTAGLSALAFGAFVAARGLIRTGREGFALSLQTEQNRIAFRGLTGSSFRANRVLDELENVARRTTLTFGEVQRQVPLLLTARFNPNELGEITEAVGDLRAGLPQANFRQVLVNLGQIRLAQTAQTRDLREFAIQGIPIFEALRNVTGEADINSAVEQSRISSRDVVDAFLSLSQSGRFQGLAAAQQQSTQGQFAQTRENLVLSFRQLGRAIDPLLNSVAMTTQQLTNASLEVTRFYTRLAQLFPNFRERTVEAIVNAINPDFQTGRERDVQAEVDALARRREDIRGVLGRDAELADSFSRFVLTPQQRELRELAAALVGPRVQLDQADSRSVEFARAQQLEASIQRRIANLGRGETSRTSDTIFGSQEFFNRLAETNLDSSVTANDRLAALAVTTEAVTVKLAQLNSDLGSATSQTRRNIRDIDGSLVIPVESVDGNNRVSITLRVQ